MYKINCIRNNFGSLNKTDEATNIKKYIFSKSLFLHYLDLGTIDK